MADKILYQSKLFQVIQRTKLSTFEANGETKQKELTFEFVRRPPGVRALIVSENRIMLNKEYRFELEDWDYRLPGGKVFDDAASYQAALENGTLPMAVERQLANELREEADLAVEHYELLKKSTSGLTVEWDLYYFIVDGFQILPGFDSKDQQKSEYEYIEHVWLSFEDALNLCINNKVSEDRSASILMRFLLQKMQESK